MRRTLARIRGHARTFTKKTRIPGYRPLTLYSFGKVFLDAYRQGNVTQRAAAMTFYFILALFPLTIFLFSLIPFVPVEGLQDQMMTAIRKSMPSPDVYEFFRGTLEDLLLKRHSVLLSVSFILGIYFSSNAVFSILNGLNGSYYIKTKGRVWKQKLWSIALLFIFIFLFVFSFMLSGLGGFAIEWLDDKNIITGGIAHFLLELLRFSLSVLFFIVGISVLYNVANAQRLHWKIFSAGAVSATLLIFLMKVVFGWYLVNFSTYSNVYGPLGSMLAFLLFIFYTFLILLIGFEINVSLQHALRKSQEASPVADTGKK